MDDDVMKTYTLKSSEARHYIQYDQGEDRWLCTLLLQAGNHQSNNNNNIKREKADESRNIIHKYTNNKILQQT